MLEFESFYVRCRRTYVLNSENILTVNTTLSVFSSLVLDKITFEWAVIIYDMSKARHLKWSVSLIPFYLIRQPAL